jgi:hypothetical protein
MLEGNGFLFNYFRYILLQQKIDFSLDGHKFAITLHARYVPDLTKHVVYRDVEESEYQSGHGYTHGGIVIPKTECHIDNISYEAYLYGENVCWAELSLDPPVPSHAILRDISYPEELLIGGWELGVQACDGKDFQLIFDKILEQK